MYAYNPIHEYKWSSGMFFSVHKLWSAKGMSCCVYSNLLNLNSGGHHIRKHLVSIVIHYMEPNDAFQPSNLTVLQTQPMTVIHQNRHLMVILTKIL